MPASFVRGLVERLETEEQLCGLAEAEEQQLPAGFVAGRRQQEPQTARRIAPLVGSIVVGSVLLCVGVAVMGSGASSFSWAGHHPSPVGLAGVPVNSWRPVLDPATKRTYYYNAALHQTSWSNPEASPQTPTYTYNQNLAYDPSYTAQATTAAQVVPAGAAAGMQPGGQAIIDVPAAAAAQPAPKPAPSPMEEEHMHVCPGSIDFAGVGPVQLVNAKWNQPGDAGGDVLVAEGNIVASMKGRTYFGTECTPTKYDHTKYLSLNLLGKTFGYTTDLSSVQCGCNSALYLTSMASHADPSMCYDHYCDASSVCSGTCAEMDLQEANNRAWFSTMHMSGDSQGLGGGYGFNRHDWNSTTYGPGSPCIDTRRAFRVEVSFPLDKMGSLSSMDLRLSQIGSACPGLFASVPAGLYGFRGRKGKEEVTRAMAQGMTPIISYWSQPGVDGMTWMDGPGPYQPAPGPCQKSEAETCGSTVTFRDFSLTDIGR